jgi:hypothetical protein
MSELWKAMVSAGATASGSDAEDFQIGLLAALRTLRDHGPLDRIERTRQILETYLVRTLPMGRSAIAKWERKGKKV